MKKDKFNLDSQQIQLYDNRVSKHILNKTVLVTGAGGSIGSEICRQIIKYKPQKLLMLDIYENNLYDIEIELKESYPEVEIVAIIASIRDGKRIEKIFEEYRPQIVLHAAAHKHVPLMESNPKEAIKNNVFGTINVVECADKYEVKKFILLSTDKAVNPTSIMGVTKRICEIIIQLKNMKSKTNYAAVRFGNVIGSNGSVIPLFKKQISKGGPITLTHKEIERYFMTIPEAVELIMQTMIYAKGGETFILNMGQPVKIYDLAENLIRQAGLNPNKDIEIKITGLRPGEKLYEELLMEEERKIEMKNKDICMIESIGIDEEAIYNNLEHLRQIVFDEDTKMEEIKKIVKRMIPVYDTSSVVNNYQKDIMEKEYIVK